MHTEGHQSPTSPPEATRLRLAHAALAIPAVFRLFSRLVLGDGGRRYVAEYVRPVPGERLLDIGCGTGDILDYLPAPVYTGFDISVAYVEAARRRFGSRGEFFVGDAGDRRLLDRCPAGTFDVVLATAVIHHLDDAAALQLLSLAAHALRPGGRLITIDPCFTRSQPALARWFVSNDRGRYVRDPDGYLQLATRIFQATNIAVREDLLRIPYTHAIMRCLKS